MEENNTPKNLHKLSSRGMFGQECWMLYKKKDLYFLHYIDFNCQLVHRKNPPKQVSSFLIDHCSVQLGKPKMETPERDLKFHKSNISKRLQIYLGEFIIPFGYRNQNLASRSEYEASSCNCYADVHTHEETHVL